VVTLSEKPGLHQGSPNVNLVRNIIGTYWRKISNGVKARVTLRGESPAETPLKKG
jgi:hypothetical protein